MSIKLIGYSSDDEVAYWRHGGERPAKRRKEKGTAKQATRQEFLRKNIKSGQFKCCYCGDPLTNENFTKDHIIPIFRGGTHRMANLRPCCYDCNIEKGDMMPNTYIQYLELMLAEYPDGSEVSHRTKIKINNAEILANPNK